MILAVGQCTNEFRVCAHTIEFHFILEQSTHTSAPLHISTAKQNKTKQKADEPYFTRFTQRNRMFLLTNVMTQSHFHTHIYRVRAVSCELPILRATN